MKKFKQFAKKYWWLLLVAVLIAGYFVRPGDGGFKQYATTGSSYNYDYSYAEEEYYDDYAYDETMPSSRTLAANGDVSAEAYEQKIIKTGSLTLHMDDVRNSVDEIEEYVGGLGGSVLDSSVSRGDNSYYAYMTVRVPAEDFEVAVEALKEMSIYVDYEYTNADDVTETYLDLEARLNNYEAEEAQYLEIMDRANTVEEILQVTEALSNVRYYIESIESSLSYYDTRVAYSTIDLTLSEDDSVSAVTGKWRPISTIRDAFSDWVAFLQGSVDWVIYAFIFVWPLVLVYVIWRWRKRRR